MHIKHSRPITKNGTVILGVVFEQDIVNSEGMLKRLGGVLTFSQLFFFSIEFILGDSIVQKYLFEHLGV